jgi:hypothetical protein
MRTNPIDLATRIPFARAGFYQGKEKRLGSLDNIIETVGLLGQRAG